MMKIQLFLNTFFDTLRLAAHLEKFDGRLVRRGTPFEKNCSKRQNKSNYLIIYKNVQIMGQENVCDVNYELPLIDFVIQAVLEIHDEVAAQIQNSTEEVEYIDGVSRYVITKLVQFVEYVAFLLLYKHGTLLMSVV